MLGLTDGNLSVHARKLEEAGYVECTKSFEGRMPRTEFRLTDARPRARSSATWTTWKRSSRPCATADPVSFFTRWLYDAKHFAESSRRTAGCTWR